MASISMEQTRPRLTQALISLLGLTYFLGMTLLIYWAFAEWAYDDPFITYRYAQNVARGIGFVYNAGERVQSTTTPLFTLVLAALGWLWPDLPHLANLVGAASLAAGGLCLFSLGRAYSTPGAAVVGLLAYPVFPQVATSMGSETPLYLALILGSLLAFEKRHYNLMCLLAALAALARPDGILIAAVLAGAYLFRHARRARLGDWLAGLPWGGMAVGAALLGAWVVFAWWFFGSPVPVTLYAKQGQGLMEISQKFMPGLLTAASYYSDWFYPVQAGLALVGLFWLLAKGRGWLPLLAWTLIYFGSYAALGVSRYFWYYSPLAAGFLVLAGLGIDGLCSVGGYLLNQLRLMDRRRMASLAELAAVLLALLLGGVQLWAVLARPLPLTARENLYRDIGLWLADNTPGDAPVGGLEIGIIGYYSQRRMIDFAGLLQPETARQIHPGTTYNDLANFAMERYEPEYLVLFLPEDVQDDLTAGCMLIKEFRGAGYGSARDMGVFDCRFKH